MCESGNETRGEGTPASRQTPHFLIERSRQRCIASTFGKLLDAHDADRVALLKGEHIAGTNGCAGFCPALAIDAHAALKNGGDSQWTRAEEARNPEKFVEALGRHAYVCVPPFNRARAAKGLLGSSCGARS